MATSNTMSANDNDEMVGGVLDTTEQRIAELLAGERRGGILNPGLMNQWSDPYPLTGFRPKLREDKGHAQYKDRDIAAETKAMYEDYQQMEGTQHGSKPPETMLPSSIPLNFKPLSRDSYKRGANTTEATISVINLSRIMYNLLGHTKQSLHWNLTNTDREINKSTERARFIEARQLAAAQICRSIMMSNKEVMLHFT